MTFASSTKVPVDRTRGEIESLLRKNGADRIAVFQEPGRAAILFEAKERRLKFMVSLPASKPGENGATQRTREQIIRSRWRALLLCIKAKLESVESGIETFEEAFLAHVVMPDGSTVGDNAIRAISTAYKTGAMVPLLPGPK